MVMLKLVFNSAREKKLKYSFFYRQQVSKIAAEAGIKFWLIYIERHFYEKIFEKIIGCYKRVSDGLRIALRQFALISTRHIDVIPVADFGV